MGFWKDGLSEHSMMIREQKLEIEARRKREEARNKAAKKKSRSDPLVTRKGVIRGGDAFFDGLGIGPSNVNRSKGNRRG